MGLLDICNRQYLPFLTATFLTTSERLQGDCEPVCDAGADGASFVLSIGTVAIIDLPATLLDRPCKARERKDPSRGPEVNAAGVKEEAGGGGGGGGRWGLKEGTTRGGAGGGGDA